MKKFLKPILAVLLFLLVQAVAGVVAAGIMMIMPSASNESVFSKMNQIATDPVFLGVSLIFSGLLTIIALIVFKLAKKEALCDVASINWKWSIIAILAAICGIFATDLVSEWADLPNIMQEQFIGMSQSIYGILAIAIIGPIAEEFTFREAVIGQLLKQKVNPWVAIMFSSLCFGLIHGNPAQIPFAFVVGLIFGVIYVKTGNIVVTSILHVINNSVAVIQMNILGESAADSSYKDILGNADIPLIVILSALCVFVMCKFYKNYPTQSEGVGMGLVNDKI